MNTPLIQQIKIVEAITEAQGAAGQTAINGAAVDMTDFENVLVVVTFGTIAAGAVTSVKVQRDTASSMATAADIEGSGQTVADDDDGKTFYADITRPGERYVRVVVGRATQNATVRSAFYVLYGARKMPTTQGALILGETHRDRIEGTA